MTYLDSIISLLSHNLITSSKGKVNISDIWPDTKDLVICLMIATIFALWSAFLNKRHAHVFACMIFHSCEKWYHKLVDALFFGLFAYLAIAAFYIVGHDVSHKF